MRKENRRTAWNRGTSVSLALLFSLCFSLPLAAQSALSLYEQGKRYQNRLNYFDAIERFHESLRINPDYGEAWFALADCEYNLGNFDLALSYLDKAETYSRDGAAVSVLRAFVLIAKGNLSEADALLQKVISSAPNNVEARFALAELDLFYGRVSSAEGQYLQALRREGTNRRVLLSLAAISAELGKGKEAEHYVDEAIRYHGSHPDVHYIAAFLALERGNFTEAELRARTALDLFPGHEKAADVLQLSLLCQGRYEETAALCNERIAVAPDSLQARYVQALALEKLSREAEAVDTLALGVQRFPNDEILRFFLESLVMKGFAPASDPRRAAWAAYHVTRARGAQAAFQTHEALSEYEKALRLDPSMRSAVLERAELLRAALTVNRYISALLSAQKEAPLPRAVQDRLEGYVSANAGSLEKIWGADAAAAAAKKRWRLGVFFTYNPAQLRHFEGERILASMLGDALEADSGVEAVTSSEEVTSYGAAFRESERRGYDYFAVIRFDENERELTLTGTLYAGKTGSGIDRITAFATGNDRVSRSISLLSAQILSSLPHYGALIDRRGDEVLLDLGKEAGLKAGDELLVLRKGALKTRDAAWGLVYRAEDILGTVTVTRADDDLAVGKLKKSGFYDYVNIGDSVVLPTAPEAKAPTAPVLEAAAETRRAAAVTDVRLGTTTASRLPGILEVLRSIR